MIKTIKQLSTVAILVAGTCGMAQAGQVSHITTATANLIVNAVEKVSIEITPVTGLMAGKFEEGKTLATANISATSGPIAYRWTPNLNTQLVQSDGTVVLHATNDASYTLPVLLKDTKGATEKMDGGSHSWMVTPDGTRDDVLTVSVASETTVLAGTYPLSLDAAIWSE